MTLMPSITEGVLRCLYTNAPAPLATVGRTPRPSPFNDSLTMADAGALSAGRDRFGASGWASLVVLEPNCVGRCAVGLPII